MSEQKTFDLDPLAARVRKRMPRELSAEGGRVCASVALSDPDDDLPRLVAADWFDDADLPDRARLIRDQVAGVLPDLIVRPPRHLVAGKISVRVERADAKVPPLGFDPQAAVDAAAPLLALPGLTEAVVRRGFVEELAFDYLHRFWTPGPLAAACYPLVAVTVAYAQPRVRRAGGLEYRYWQGYEPDGKVNGYEGDGFIPNAVLEQARNDGPMLPVASFRQLGVGDDDRQAGFLPLVEGGNVVGAEGIAKAELSWALARWAAVTAYVQGLFPGPLASRSLAAHASRPLLSAGG